MPPAKLALSFRIFQGNQLIREERLVQGVIKIGKVPSAHLRLDDESVSRMHAIIEVTGGEVSLIDLGSTRGTHVNGKKINKARLQSGDVLEIGDIRIELAISDAAASAPAASTPAASTSAAPSRRPITAGTVSMAAGELVTPLDRAPDPVAFRRAVAETADDAGGARAVEVAAMLGDSVIGVKHCMDPRGGKVTRTTWALAAAGVAFLATSVIAFAISVRTASDNASRRDRWVRVEHKPERAFRPQPLGPGVAWGAFGGLALALVGLTSALVRARGERTSPFYRIGTAPGVEMPLESAPLPAFPLVAPSGDDFVFNYGAGIDGELIVDGEATPFDALAAAGRARPSPATAGAIEVPIPPRAKIRARAGQATFVISAVARPRRHTTALLARFESRAMAYVAASLVLHLAAWGLLQTIPPEEAAPVVIPDSLEELAMRAAIIAMGDKVPEPIEDRGDGSGEQQPLPSMALPSGATGNPEAPRADGRLRVVRNDDPPRLSREEAVQLAMREGILGSEQLLSGVRALSATADLPSGFDTENVNGPIYGLDGPGRGSFGGGVTGIDLGGGCMNADCTGTYPGSARYATINGGPHAGGDYKLPFGNGPHQRGHQPTPPHLGDPVTTGAGYDKAIIRRYIRRHINEIAYCYDKQLLAHPELAGEVMATFLISASGVVQSSTAKGFDASVDGCIAGVIKTIEFPATGDGGGVQVNYPFRFHGATQ
ncbi:MAG TPA: AgmX/PglI C-terminal domain-containing protein [Kofleriaceae bacterium]|nr:AgmX/PglI C-terminal domain-containing protein [Kofleriaceae bacterium]